MQLLSPTHFRFGLFSWGLILSFDNMFSVPSAKNKVVQVVSCRRNLQHFKFNPAKKDELFEDEIQTCV